MNSPFDYITALWYYKRQRIIRVFNKTELSGLDLALT
jgi:hypothetical protein